MGLYGLIRRKNSLISAKDIRCGSFDYWVDLYRATTDLLSDAFSKNYHKTPDALSDEINGMSTNFWVYDEAPNVNCGWIARQKTTRDTLQEETDRWLNGIEI